MKPLLFIHGTGTRRKSFDETVAEVTKQVAHWLPQYSVREGYWGEPFGSGNWEKSLPEGPSQNDLDAAAVVALWRNLLADPYHELRLLEALPKPADDFDTAEGLAIWHKLEDLALPEKAQTILQDNALTPFWDNALQGLLTEEFEGESSPRWRNVLAYAPNPSDTRQAVARCLVAHTMQQAQQLYRMPMSADERTELVDMTVDELGGVSRSVSSFLAQVALGGALLISNPFIRSSRDEITTDVGPNSGDILLYQARGQNIRDFIEKRINDEYEKDGPVVIVAHSLGGISSLDLLITKDLFSKVRALITVGSQAAYLYEIGALWSLERTKDSTLPAHFPSQPNEHGAPNKRWMNVLNRWDFLSYPAQRVFPAHVHDFEVSGLSPFPISHSAYWKKREMWEAIERFVR